MVSGGDYEILINQGETIRQDGGTIIVGETKMVEVPEGDEQIILFEVDFGDIDLASIVIESSDFVRNELIDSRSEYLEPFNAFQSFEDNIYSSTQVYNVFGSGLYQMTVVAEQSFTVSVLEGDASWV